MMEEKNERGRNVMMMRPPPPETAEFFLQWGSRKRLRCVRIRSSSGNTSATATSTSPPHHLSSSSTLPDPVLSSSNSSTRIRRKITSRFPSVTSNDEKHLSFPQPTSRLTRNSEAAVTLRSDSRRVSPEKEERSYTTRGSSGPVVTNLEENGGGKVPQVDFHGNQGGHEQPNHHHHQNNDYKNSNHHSNRGNGNGNGNGGGNLVWPKLYITLSSKEKEDDFLAMKGCKLPQRPKKRAKLIQRTVLLVSPGGWLTDVSLERYEVREKKTSKKRPRGLKAMGNMETDSE